jgi:hypothetical protein
MEGVEISDEYLTRRGNDMTKQISVAASKESV